MKVLSWNMRGLNNPQKQYALKNCIFHNKIEVLLLQEVKMNDAPFSLITGKIWPGAEFFISDASGASSGLAAMWDPSEFYGSLITTSANFIFSRLSCTLDSWFLINVYVPKIRMGKLIMWNNITALLQNDHNTHWMIVGGFNSFLFPSRKLGGLLVYSDIISDLVDFIGRNGLLDVDLIGQRFA